MAKAKQQPKKEQAPKAPGTRSEAPPRLLQAYRETMTQQLTKEFDYGNAMQVPRVDKIVVNIGLREQVIFPEIDYDKIDKLRGLEVSIITTAKTDDEARSLLTRLGMPFRKR